MTPGLDISVPAEGAPQSPIGPRKAEKCPESLFLPPALVPVCCAEWREQDYQQAEVLRVAEFDPTREVN